MDPYNLGNIILGASTSQWGNRTPKYGEGGSAYGERFGAAWADLATQNLFSAGVLATLLHQDPRYYRRGPRSGILVRVGYSLSRVAVARQDSGASAFNASGVGGMMLGIAASNAYYPSESVCGRVMASRITTSLTGSITGNLLVGVLARRSEVVLPPQASRRKLSHHRFRRRSGSQTAPLIRKNASASRASTRTRADDQKSNTQHSHPAGVNRDWLACCAAFQPEKHRNCSYCGQQFPPAAGTRFADQQFGVQEIVFAPGDGEGQTQGALASSGCAALHPAPSFGTPIAPGFGAAVPSAAHAEDLRQPPCNDLGLTRLEGPGADFDRTLCVWLGHRFYLRRSFP